LQKDVNHSVKDICEIVGISRNTYYKYTRSWDNAEIAKKQWVKAKYRDVA
jgi:ACT domain-containing protein